MKLTIGCYEVEISARNKRLGHTCLCDNDAVQFLREIAMMLYSAAKWEFKQGNRFTAESAKSWGDSLTETLQIVDKFERG